MTASARALIEVSGLRKCFGALTAVKDLGFSVYPGEIFGLVGPDGAGKTTTLRMLSSVMRPDAGHILIDGIDAQAAPDQVKRHVSYMPQRFGMYEDLTVYENIRFYADLFEVPDALWRSRAASLLAAADMTPFKQRLAGQLSGGMKQKLGLVCSLVHTPRVLLLDEPTTGVDPLSRREFWQILYSLRSEGVAMLISTAYLDEAERCDRLALLHQGRMMFCDTPTGLKAHMPGAMLEVIADEPRLARDMIKNLPGVRSVLMAGIGIHVHVEGLDVIDSIRATLAERNMGVSRIEAVAPTIEDLFVALLEQQNPQAQAA